MLYDYYNIEEDLRIKVYADDIYDADKKMSIILHDLCFYTDSEYEIVWDDSTNSGMIYPMSVFVG